MLNGADTINLNSGTLGGSISGGGGPDTFNLNDATVNGTLNGGEASTDIRGDPLRDPQPNHVDTFNLNAGTINAPTSGDAIVAERGDDLITIGGVTINGNVSGGRGADRITMTGGTVTGSIFGEGTLGAQGGGPSDEDTIILNGGTVSGNVSGNLENDSITLAGAAVAGAVSGNEGNDVILWSAGFAGAINGNDGTDLATFRNLTPTNLTPGVLVDGGLGSGDQTGLGPHRWRRGRSATSTGSFSSLPTLATDVFQHADTWRLRNRHRHVIDRSDQHCVCRQMARIRSFRSQRADWSPSTMPARST